MTPEAQIRLHRIRNDQMYHHYLGDALDVLLLHEDGVGEVWTIGWDTRSGMRPQPFISGGTFHMSRLHAGYALLGTTEWPGVEPPDVEVGGADALAARHRGWAQALKRFADPLAQGKSA